MIYDIALSLRLNVDELTRTHLQTAESAHSIDGQTLIERNSGQVPGLIEQLRDSCREGIGGNGGTSGFAPKIPIQVGAYTLYESIAKTAGMEYERLTERAEVLEDIRKHLKEAVLISYLKDTERAMVLDSTGRYVRPEPTGSDTFDSQQHLLKHYADSSTE